METRVLILCFCYSHSAVVAALDLSTLQSVAISCPPFLVLDADQKVTVHRVVWEPPRHASSISLKPPYTSLSKSQSSI